MVEYSVQGLGCVGVSKKKGLGSVGFPSISNIVWFNLAVIVLVKKDLCQP
jgi:hypothetical protein